MAKKRSPNNLTADQAKAQAQLMMQERIKGRSMGEIAKIFGVHKRSVGRRLQLAEVQEIFQKARDVVAVHLVPSALEVMQEKLDVDRDGERAKDVLFGTGILNKTVALAVVPQGDDDFDHWRLKRKALEPAADPIDVAPGGATSDAAGDPKGEPEDGGENSGGGGMVH